MTPSIGISWLLLPMNFSDAIDLSLLLTHVETVFLGTPYFAATSLLVYQNVAFHI